MDAKKAELVERLNAINQRIDEMGLWVSPQLLEMRDKIIQELDLLSKQLKDEWRD